MPGRPGYTPSPINQINFGKHKGKTFEQVFAIDPEYIRWLRDTTDPADVKNEGKYAKQNQERIKYLGNLLNEGVSISVDTPTNVNVSSTLPVAKAINVNTTTFENITKILLSIEEKIDKLLKKNPPDNELCADEETPF